MFWGFVLMALLPASPLDAGPLFNVREKALLRRRFEENPFARDRQAFQWSQAREALLDPKTWLYLLVGALVYLCNGAVTAFGTIIIKSLGYSGLQSVALTIPGGAVTCVCIWLFGWLADRYRDSRTWLFPLSCVPVVVGAIVVWTAPWRPTAGPLIGYYLVAAFGAPYVLLLALASANTAGSTKKAVTNGAIFVGYNAGNIASSYTVKTQEVRVKYRSTWITVIVAMVAASCIMGVLRLMLRRQQRANEADMLDDDEVVMKVEEYRDLTDRQIRGFKYSL